MTAYLTEVLVIDDAEYARRLVSTTLTRAGFKVREADSAEAAMRMLLKQPQIRLVVCDWNMPGMSGLDFVRQLRADLDRRSTFVLVCTGNTEPAQIAEAFEAGADDYVRKPWHEAELIARVRWGQQRIALDTSEALVFSLAALAESRDPETGAHLERVQRYCRLLADGLSEDSAYSGEIDGSLVHLIEQTSVLHDIGKVGIPDSILRKPARLTLTEFNVMKSHTKIGAHALDAALRQSTSAPFLSVAHQIALYHHERWDGTGYPFGMAQRRIPLPARILAVADVYDALRSRRVYKDDYTHEEAVATIEAGAGTQFDPVVVESFSRNQAEFDSVVSLYSDVSAAREIAGANPEYVLAQC